MFHLVTTNQEIDKVVQIAKTIWTEHYTPIIGIEQVEYMLNHYHSKYAISNEINQKGFVYYLIKKQKKYIGYLSYRSEKNTIRLSKIYLYTSERHQGFGKQCLNLIKKIAQENAINNIYLTVNKSNIDSIKAYERMGFEKTENICTNIGEGYKMDDFKMILKLL